MSQIKQLLLLKKEGVSNRKAADIVGINKETANNYVRKALADELGIDGLLKLDVPVLEHRLKGGTPAYTDKRFEVFKELLPYLQEEMKRKHVTPSFCGRNTCRNIPMTITALPSSASTIARIRRQGRNLPQQSLPTCVLAVRNSSSTLRGTLWDT